MHRVHTFDACEVSNIATFSGVVKFLLNKIVTCLKKIVPIISVGTLIILHLSKNGTHLVLDIFFQLQQTEYLRSMEGEPTQLCYQQKIQLLPFLPSMSSWEALNGQKYSVYYMFFLCIFLFNLQEESIKFV